MNKRELSMVKSKVLIHEAALKLFGVYGYNGTSIRMIAKEANVSVGLLYNYYDGKEGLVKTIFESNIKFFSEVFNSNTFGSPLCFDVLLETIFTTIEENISFWKLVYSVRLQEPLSEILATSLLRVEFALLDEIKKVLHSYKFSNLEGEAYLLYSVIEGVIQNSLSSSSYPKKQVLELLKFKYSKLLIS